MTEHQKKLCEIFAEISNNKSNIQISLDTKIRDLRLDSLDVLDLLMKINNDLGVDIAIENFMLCEDVSSVDAEMARIRNAGPV
ncbi:phosphopantetheine-binding protein [Methylotenera sp. G11]|uniref:phosphopantetheine-binding protein n=1 Tax=Methylotenera sp. G11 TaxID=1506585 RepID=UPI00064779DC|nr:phosphopantetheine-binding protein [Methylotenera sp. G11]